MVFLEFFMTNRQRQQNLSNISRFSPIRLARDRPDFTNEQLHPMKS